MTFPATPLPTAPDLDVNAFEGVEVSIPALMARFVSRGSLMVRHVRFKDCLLRGPSIVLVGRGTTFRDTNFGDGRGQVANLLLRPVGDKVIGAVPLVDCVFEGCEFSDVGFTGAETFLNAVLALDDTPRFGRLT